MLSLSSYSQTDTTKITVSDPDKVIISKKTAILITQDLFRYDGLKLEIVELKNVIGLKDQQINLFKQKDTLKDQKISNLEVIINKKDEQFGLERQKSESLLRELKGQRRKTFLYKVGSFAGIIMTSLYLLK
jgi:hypothetical protein